MEQRWGFMLPWCKVLHKKIKFKPVERDWDVWADQKYRLEVSLPMRCHFTEDSDGEEFELDMEWSGEDYFQDTFCQVREALALLAAVAHVDQLAWKYLLSEHCGVNLGKAGSAKLGRDIRAEYFLVLDQDEDVRTAFEEEHQGLDLVLFCGTDHQIRPVEGYLETLAEIAALDTKLKYHKPGVEVLIPVQSLYPCHALSSDEGPKILKNILRAEQTIHEMRKSFETLEVPHGELRCTFVLKPLVADLEDVMTWMEMATKVGKLMTRGLCFSEVSLRAERLVRHFGSELESRKVFGQLMTHLFGSTRRSRELTYSGHFGCDAEQHQLDLLLLDCEPTLLSVDLHAMGSAMVVNKTTKNLAMHLMFPLQLEGDFSFDDEITTREWWQWIAYAFFSKRARECSSLKSLALVNLRTMCFEDMEEAFSAILNSEHPEEEVSVSSRQVGGA
ncbi:hypothetical protein PF005_g16730 [Phytophthora fragariae]|uniref:Uncharacterized protein n=1 Tax=Phytophthora fragariae TaxID=53985 RepID=A0A6A3T9M9_9STRA|nr:hypothetical protein PF009_g12376 [Phytophthora fragariae]KAE9096233.1 hypothetical protein PF010_g16424 [Phytophthora fragariae]KAE9132587.1 hypothetical protein PF006_g15250 [Phytophthora fragariae]KAE9196807.1 hypothetical protein PF005_g16730 [Phytophthora fragariae]KAE9213045.1 hypothetical protein PF002_g18076 [Phytophthora fragariae]